VEVFAVKLGQASFPSGRASSKEKLRRRLSLVGVCRCLRDQALGLTRRRGRWLSCNGNSNSRRGRGVHGSCLPLQGSVGLLPTVRKQVAAQARERATKKKTDALPAGQVGGGWAAAGDAVKRQEHGPSPQWPAGAVIITSRWRMLPPAYSRKASCEQDRGPSVRRCRDAGPGLTERWCVGACGMRLAPNLDYSPQAFLIATPRPCFSPARSSC
jgi:hypothetical protein